MRYISKSLLLLFALMVSTLRADIVTLTDGRTVEGDILEENATEVVIKAKVGKTTIKREEIQSIDKKKTDASVLKAKMDELEKSASKKDTDAWLKLAESAKAKHELAEARRAYEQVVKLDPNNETARTELGFVEANGKWIAKSELKEPSTKTPFDVNKNSAAASSAYMTKEKLAMAAGVQGFSAEGEKPVDCPNCHGTGIWVMLPCLNCNKSGKPGYKNLGDRYEMDQRCNGTGKTIGAYCDVCNRTGKVLLSHLALAQGGTRKPNSGMQWCPVCNGTGYEQIDPCNQCKRSKWPGYLFMGDHLEMCNSCNGAGKKATLGCGTCNKTGMVPLKVNDPQKQFGVK